MRCSIVGSAAASAGAVVVSAITVVVVVFSSTTVVVASCANAGDKVREPAARIAAARRASVLVFMSIVVLS